MRERSMKKDKHDDAAFRHSRERHMGVCVSSEFYQPCPMFFTREGSQLNIIGHYRGSSIFLICNGPSFAKLDHSLLRKPGVMTFGINNGPKTFRPNFWTCVDSPERFIKSIWLDPFIMKFIPQATMEKPIFDNEAWNMSKKLAGECPNIIGYRRNEKFMAQRFLFEDTINWGNHKDYGGCRSVMLPSLRICFLLGFRKIYLLGCDLNMTEEYTYHFDEQRAKGAVNCNNSTYQRMISEYFPQLKPEFEAAGLQVFNCNPDSALKVFPFISYEDAIKEATAPLGDVEHERTWGMYSKSDEKIKWKEEPKEEQKKNIKVLKQLQAEKEQRQIQTQIVNIEPVSEGTQEVEEQCVSDCTVTPMDIPEKLTQLAQDVPIVAPEPQDKPQDVTEKAQAIPQPQVFNETVILPEAMHNHQKLPPPNTIQLPLDQTVGHG
jgi:hypothetical protein